MAKYENEVLRKIATELQQAPGITNVKICYNKVGDYIDLKNEFEEIIGNIDYNTEVSQLKYLPIDHKKFLPLSENDKVDGVVEKFKIRTMNLPVRIIDHNKFILQEMGNLPLLVIEE